MFDASASFLILKVRVQNKNKKDQAVQGGETLSNGKASQRRNSMCHFIGLFEQPLKPLFSLIH